MFSMFDDDKSYGEKLSKKNEGVAIQIEFSGTFYWEDDLWVRWERDERASQVTTWKKSLSGRRRSDKGPGWHRAWHVWEGTRKWEGQWWGEEVCKGVREAMSRIGLSSWTDLRPMWLPWHFLWVALGSQWRFLSRGKWFGFHCNRFFLADVLGVDSRSPEKTQEV